MNDTLRLTRRMDVYLALLAREGERWPAERTPPEHEALCFCVACLGGKKNAPTMPREGTHRDDT